MISTEAKSALQKTKDSWFCFTPDGMMLGLLAVDGFLLASEKYCWFAFNTHKCWALLIAIASVIFVIAFMLLWFVLALIFHCRFQFGIRSLFVLTLVIAIPSSWRAVEIQHTKRQLEAAKSLEKFGASLTPQYDYDIVHHRILYELGVLTGIDRYLITGTHVWFDTAATNDMLSHLKDLPPVEYLCVDNSPITDEGLRHLQHLTELNKLDLQKTLISDAGLIYIKDLPKLDMLHLDDTQISDEGLQHLASCTSLSYLSISRTKVSKEGVEKLQKSLPKCSISWE
jgi:hypothetical protein